MSLLEQLRAHTFVECSHFIDGNTFLWPGGSALSRCPFKTLEADGYAKELYTVSCDGGTHVDSPSHFFKGKRTITDIKLEELVAPAVVLDITAKSAENPDYQATVDDLLAWEARHGPVPKGAIVCLHTGWGAKWATAAYPNVEEGTTHPCYPGGKMHFPGFSGALANFLVKERDINGVGIDTLSLDPGISTTFDCHGAMLSNDKYQIENMDLTNVPEAGAIFVVFPMKVRDAPESLSRIAALVPK